MTCDEVQATLVDFVDNGIDPSNRAEVERHLSACDTCRRLVADLRHIRQVAATLERQPLPVEAWDQARRRLEADEGFRTARAGGAMRPSPASRRWLAAAALLVVAVSAGLWRVGRSQPAGEPVSRAAVSSGAPSRDQLVESIEAELQMAATHYEKAILGLEQIASASDSPLDPAMTTTLRESLAVIDRAIAESRGALRTSPDSQVAQENLLEAFRRKVSLLQDTIALMNEMRKGDEAGAARIVEELNKS